MIHKRRAQAKGKIIVRFEIPGSIWAEKINLVGDFNDWDETSLPFRHNRQGNWEIELMLEADCEYRFRYLFDDTEWSDELQADRFVPNAYGSHDSVVVTTLKDDQSTP